MTPQDLTSEKIALAVGFIDMVIKNLPKEYVDNDFIKDRVKDTQELCIFIKSLLITSSLEEFEEKIKEIIKNDRKEPDRTHLYDKDYISGITNG